MTLFLVDGDFSTKGYCTILFTGSEDFWEANTETGVYQSISPGCAIIYIIFNSCIRKPCRKKKEDPRPIVPYFLFDGR
jgi:hypothetical protein